MLVDAVFKRNSYVEETLKAKITVFDPGKSNYVPTLTTSVKSGECEYALCDINANTVTNLITGGLIHSTSVLDTDFSKPWYHQKTASQFTFCGKTFAYAPDTLFIDKLEAVVTFYNKKMGADYGIGSLHQIAKDGKFTLDCMLQYAAEVTSDLNADGKMDQNDTYCISCQNDYGYYALLSAGYSSFVTENDNIVLALNEEKILDVLNKTGEIMGDPAIFFNRQTYSLPIGQVCQMFANKQALFLVRPLQTLYDLRDFDHDFEILPAAKFTEDQADYSTPVNSYAGTVFCVPRARNDYADIALVSDLLAAESYYDVMPVFYDVVLDYRLVPDPGAAEILDIVFDKRSYDLGIVFNFGSVRNVLVAPKIGNLSSQIKTVEKAAEKTVSNLMKQISEMAD